MGHRFGKFVRFEHLSPQPAKARQFHEALLGWKGKAFVEDGSSPAHWRCWQWR